ncbi:tripartite tricarboxylate transporter substrate binding protein [Brevibacterium casei]|uniref:Putative tricarboxylic transport membrane protein n=1 Tax=Brevibacterium casei CIP 102111 TaxID=1255625 RepID=A0A2H1JCX2_9MICO|nr:tripartite tricarboxylate transporter substrate-binding protein [Brevibacterium casei]MCT1549811.1 tripartite tricarboxylate transporter substrate-binding protein [Brevibacterium casei]MCT1560820.1 tripartite tricarboxylate transporter substrate-binding protein [Brevibacterium casei]MCT2207355.1 tripartite tricarboxylate transporter substrate-binding protein [Brevibacterium casei]SMX85273.1 putative tricarboxylic transport membrane protein [Brevibacterium casei CIP 102111]
MRSTTITGTGRTTSAREGAQRRRWAGVGAALAATALVLSGCQGRAQPPGEGGDYPSGPVTVTAPAEPGSGWDTTARAVTEALQRDELVTTPLPVQNRPGGTGCTWLTTMMQQDKGKDDQIAITSLASQTMKARGLCEYGPQDATLIATLYVEDFIVVAPKDSDIADLDGLVSALKDDPQAVTVAAAGDDTLPFALFAKAAGVEPADVNFVNYDGGGEQTTAMLNGDAKVAIAGLSEFRSVLESGDIVPLVTFAQKPLLAPFESVPTAMDSGYDVTLGNWRGVYGPADMPQEAVDYWATTLEKMSTSTTWEDTVKKNQWAPEFRTGEDAQSYVDEAAKTVEEGVKETELGTDK